MAKRTIGLFLGIWDYPGALAVVAPVDDMEQSSLSLIRWIGGHTTAEALADSFSAMCPASLLAHCSGSISRNKPEEASAECKLVDSEHARFQVKQAGTQLEAFSFAEWVFAGHALLRPDDRPEVRLAEPALDTLGRRPEFLARYFLARLTGQLALVERPAERAGFPF